jgi:hypothetical protein
MQCLTTPELDRASYGMSRSPSFREWTGNAGVHSVYSG